MQQIKERPLISHLHKICWWDSESLFNYILSEAAPPARHLPITCQPARPLLFLFCHLLIYAYVTFFILLLLDTIKN